MVLEQLVSSLDSEITLIGFFLLVIFSHHRRAGVTACVFNR